MNKKRKNLCYSAEKWNTILYIIFLCFNIIIFVCNIIIGKITNTLSSDSIVDCLIILFLCDMFFFAIFFIDDMRKNKLRKEINNIKNNGVKIEGTILKFNEYRITEASHNGTKQHIKYTLTVEYISPYTNEKKQYETPELSFDAFHRLGSKQCSVYILNDSLYVTDFIEVKKGEDNIWVQEDEYYKTIDVLEKKEYKKVIIGIILFMLFWLMCVILCLSIK